MINNLKNKVYNLFKRIRFISTPYFLYKNRSRIPLFSYSDFRGYESTHVDESDYPEIILYRTDNYYLSLINLLWNGIINLYESALLSLTKRINHQAIPDELPIKHKYISE